MWALVQAGQIVRYITSPEPLTINNVQYPKEIFNFWSVDELLAIGIMEVVYTHTEPGPNQKHIGFVYQVMEDHVAKSDNYALKSTDEQEAARMSVVVTRIAEVNQKYLDLLEEGMPFQGKILQLREQDQQNIGNVGADAKFCLITNGTWPQNFAWIMADNTFLPRDAQGMSDLADAAKLQVISWRFNARIHKNALAACADEQAALDYDISTGWDLINPNA